MRSKCVNAGEHSTVFYGFLASPCYNSSNVMLNKKDVINKLSLDSNNFKDLLNQLTPGQLEKTDLGEGWTVKDVVAHLAAWNEEVFAEIDRILNNQATWQNLYEAKEGEDEFNRREVEKRKDSSYEEVFNEWESSCNELLNRLENLTDEQWKHKSGNDTWKLGRFKDVPVSAWSLFDYGEKTHEAEHLGALKKFFNK